MMTFNEVLIRAVFNRPAIWNPNHKFHKDRNAVLCSWEEISSEMSLDCDTLKQKWKSLRDYYRTELKKATKTEESSGSSRESKWPYFSMMSFLNVVRSHPNFNIMQKNPLEDMADDMSRTVYPDESKMELNQTDAEEDETDENDGYSRIAEPHFSRLEPTTRLYQQTFSQKSKSRSADMSYYVKKSLEIKTKKLNLLEREREDEDLMFFKSLLPDLKSLPRSKRMFLKLKFQEMLYNEIRSAEHFSMPQFRLNVQAPKDVEFSNNSSLITPKMEDISE